jgi:hypothetical protein
MSTFVVADKRHFGVAGSEKGSGNAGRKAVWRGEEETVHRTGATDQPSGYVLRRTDQVSASV